MPHASDFERESLEFGVLPRIYCNFARIHQTLKVTPAMTAGVFDKMWEVSDIVAMLEQWELWNFKPE
jgi:hypothetical protein